MVPRFFMPAKLTGKTENTSVATGSILTEGGKGMGLDVEYDWGQYDFEYEAHPPDAQHRSLVAIFVRAAVSSSAPLWTALGIGLVAAFMAWWVAGRLGWLVVWAIEQTR